MPRGEIFQAYQELPKRDPTPDPEHSKLDLRGFIENYVTSLADLIRAFPKGRLDINALEAHYWDRLKAFYPYASFVDVEIKTTEEAKFINEAIKLIEDWFYAGAWTDCLETPTEEELKQLLLHGNKNTPLQRSRRVKRASQHPNLGRDADLPNIYEDVASGRNLQEVYNNHAFKFFHGPAATINTLTKVRSRRPIEANDSKFKKLVTSASEYYPAKLRSWGYEISGASSGAKRRSLDLDASLVIAADDRMHVQPKYIRRGEEFTRNLFFYKTSLIAAELIRRTGDGELTKSGFQNIMAGIRQQTQRNPQNPDFVPFDFVPTGSRSSGLHVNTVELPFALFAVDYLKQQNDRKK